MPLPFLLIGAAVAVAGASSGIRGAKKMKEANEIVEAANGKFNRAKELMEAKQALAEEKLESYGRLKYEIWTGDFNRFIKAYEVIQNKPRFTGSLKKDELVIPPEEELELQEIASGARKIFEKTAGAALFGILGWSGTLGGISFAGGSIVSTGFGLMSGASIIGGIAGGPLMAFQGILMNYKGEKSLEKAREIEENADEAIHKLNELKGLYSKLAVCTDKMAGEVTKTRSSFLQYLDSFENTVKHKSEYSALTFGEKKTLECTYLYLKVLKAMLNISIIKQEDNRCAMDENAGSLLENAVRERDAIGSGLEL